MKKRNKFILLNVIGVLFLLFGIVAVINSIYNAYPAQILYMCYIGLILIGIGILTRKSFIIMSQVYILAIPLLAWNIDFLYWLIFNKPLLGITDYFFANTALNIGKIISLQHLFTVPLAIYAASLIGVKKGDAWKWSSIQVILVFIASLFSPRELNVNCVFESCVNIHLGLPYHLTWFLIFFVMISLTSVILNYFLIRRKSNKRKII